MTKPIVLCILDGCGIRKESFGNAFLNANKPFYNYLLSKYPNSLLEASGESVGLPRGQMGNSEVGHMNIGAGRVVYQPLEIINNAIKNDVFNKNEQILNVVNHVIKNDSNLHIMGLLSDGGVHSHINHLFKLMEVLKENNISKVYYHLFLDGRDVPPKSALKYIGELEEKIKEINLGSISTISGRYYAMDRDNNYDRLKKAYDAICLGVGPKYNSSVELINDNYKNDITDEFVVPGVINKMPINDNDGIITFNFRPDRLRELFTEITNPNESKLNGKVYNNLSVLTMMPVTDSVLCPHAFNHQDLSSTMNDFLHKNGLRQLRIAETEKYAHVTYFFNGGVDEVYDTVKQVLIPSPKVATFDLKPEMSAFEITDTLINELDNNEYDVVILNYANGDMVGHTGNYDAAVNAVECLDKCLSKLFNKVMQKQGILLVTADHGNCELMKDENGMIITSHTTNKVPFIITMDNIELNDGILADIAPTIIDLLGLQKPESMTGNSLIKK